MSMWPARRSGQPRNYGPWKRVLCPTRPTYVGSQLWVSPGSMEKVFEPKIFLLNWKANPFRALRREGINQNARLADYNWWEVICCFMCHYYFCKGFAKGSSRNVLSAFSQSYVEYDLRKNKIVVLFFCQQINFYELIIMF